MQIHNVPLKSAAPHGQPGGRPSDAAAVDFQSFLRLLTAQLRNQDPLSPLDSTQFVAQLASFSTVEQLVGANARLDGLAGMIAGDALEAHAGWIGRSAEVAGAPVRYTGAPAAFTIAPEAGAVEARLFVRDQTGAVIHQEAIANSAAIQRWSGAGGRVGDLYTLEAEFTYRDGATKVVDAAVFDEIEAVRTIGGETLFTLASGLTAGRAAIRGLAAPRGS